MTRTRAFWLCLKESRLFGMGGKLKYLARLNFLQPKPRDGCGLEDGVLTSRGYGDEAKVTAQGKEKP